MHRGPTSKARADRAYPSRERETRTDVRMPAARQANPVHGRAVRHLSPLSYLRGHEGYLRIAIRGQSSWKLLSGPGQADPTTTLGCRVSASAKAGPCRSQVGKPPRHACFYHVGEHSSNRHKRCGSAPSLDKRRNSWSEPLM